MQRFLAHFGMAVLLVAGVSKALSFGSFTASLGSWEIIPEAAIGIVAMLVVAGELLLGGMWFAGVRRRAIAWAATGMIALFTGAYLYQFLIYGPPRCECLGKLLAFRMESKQVPLVVLRNVLLLACMIAATRHANVVRATPGAAHTTPGAEAHARSGFTLIELMMVIAVVTIVAGLALMSFGSLRATAVGMSSLSLLRQHVAVFQSYGVDHKDAMPRFIEIDGTHAMHGPYGLYFRGEKLAYFSQSTFWPCAMEQQYYNGIAYTADMFIPPWTRNLELGVGKGHPYLYAATSVSRPEFWMPAERAGPEQWRTVRFAEVLFPSQKVILSAIDERVADHSPETDRVESAHLGWIDGSASIMPRRDLEPGYPGGEGRYEGSWSIFTDWPAGSHTIQGVRGLDVGARAR